MSLVTALMTIVFLGTPVGDPFESALGVRFAPDTDPLPVPEDVRASAIRHLGAGSDELDFAPGTLEDDHSFGLPAVLAGAWAASRKSVPPAAAGGTLPHFTAYFREDGRLLLAVACWDDWRELGRILYPCSDDEPLEELAIRDGRWLESLRSPDHAAGTWKVAFPERPTVWTLKEVSPALDRALNPPGPCHERQAVAVRPRNVEEASGATSVRWIAHLVSLMNLSAFLSWATDGDPAPRFEEGLDLGSKEWHLGYLVEPCPEEPTGR